MKTYALFVLLFLPQIIQGHGLSDEDVRAAIATATAAPAGAKAKDPGVEVWWRSPSFSTMGEGVQPKAVIYTPTLWVQHHALLAARKFQTLSPSDVTEDMRAGVVRVVAFPRLPQTMNAEDRRFAGSVEHVVLRDLTKKTVIQPIGQEPFDEAVANALGAAASYHGVTATFPLDAIGRVSNNDGEFLVTVVIEGARSEFDLKLQKKQASHLRDGAGQSK